MDITGTGSITGKYIRGINLIYSQNNAGTKKFYLFNGHGDVVQLTGSDGNVTKSYDYDAYGNEKNPDAADANPFRYCGEYFDKETGTYYLRARYYAPGIGRFISEDSYWGKDNDPLSLNLYTYCENEPINRIDPSGHDWLDKVIDSILNFFGISSDLDETATGPHSDMYKISTAFYWGIQTDITFFCMNYTQAFFDTIEWAAQQDAITTAISPVKQNLNSLSKGAVKTEIASSAAQYQRLKQSLATEEIQSVIKTTEHGAERLMTRGFSPSEISDLKLSPSKIMTQTDGASVYLRDVGAGKFNVIVESENGVVTALKNISQNSLDRLSKNYGWK